jgi:uncharacterized protein YggE
MMDGRWGVVAACGMAVVAGALVVAVADGDEAAPALAQSTTQGSATRTITVDGHGVVSAEPDTASVWLGVAVTAARADDALDQASRDVRSLIDAMRGLGVAADDIVTTNVSLWPQYGSNVNRITGYQASNDVRVTIRDIAAAGPVIDAAAASAGDAVRINGITFSVDDTSAAIGAARAEAMRDAAVRASQYASAGGATVGAVTQISEQQVTSPWPVQDAAATTAADRASVPIQPGTQDLTVDVTVVYELTS